MYYYNDLLFCVIPWEGSITNVLWAISGSRSSWADVSWDVSWHWELQSNKYNKLLFKVFWWMIILSIKLITWVGVPRHMSSLDSIPGVKSHLNCHNLAPDNEDIDAILVANVNSGGIIKTPAVNRSDQNSKADKRFIWHVLHATKTLISYQDLQGKLNVLFTGCGTALSAQISNCLTSMGSWREGTWSGHAHYAVIISKQA